MAYCSNCGTQVADQATTCQQCGQPTAQQRAVAAEFVPNYLVQAILTTIFCCLPFGIVSIVYAAQVNSKLLAGDVSGARESSRKARMWAWIAFGAGLASAALGIGTALIPAISGSGSGGFSF